MISRSRFPSPSLSLFLIALLCVLIPGGEAAFAIDGVDGTTRISLDDSEFAHVMDVNMVGDYAYTSIGLGQGFQAYNISDPTNIVRESAGGASAWRSWARGDTAYSFCHEIGVQLFDISAGAGVLLDTYDPPALDAHYEGGFRVGDTLFVAAHQKGLHLLDMTPFAPITHVSSVSLTNNACWNVVESGGYLYVANGRFGLSVVSLAGTPAEIASLPLPGLANDIALSGNAVFLSLGGGGIASVDISNPANPLLLDTAPTLGNAFGLGLHGDILAVGSYSYFERFDVSNPSNLVLAGWDATETYALGADIGLLASGDTIIAVADWARVGTYSAHPDAGGDIEVWPLRLDFGQVSVSKTLRDTIVVVRNNGAGSLTVDSALAPAGITVLPETFTLGAGESKLVTVTATTPDPLRNKIRWYSDDPDESVFTQFVYKRNATFPQVGSSAPDFNLFGTNFQQHRLSDYQGKVVLLEFGAAW